MFNCMKTMTYVPKVVGEALVIVVVAVNNIMLNEIDALHATSIMAGTFELRFFIIVTKMVKSASLRQMFAKKSHFAKKCTNILGSILILKV